MLYIMPLEKVVKVTKIFNGCFWKIIVPIGIDTKTKINNLMIDINRAKTIYGYNRKNPDLNKYIKDNINANKLEKIYEQKKRTQVRI